LVEEREGKSAEGKLFGLLVLMGGTADERISEEMMNGGLII